MGIQTETSVNVELEMLKFMYTLTPNIALKLKLIANIETDIIHKQ